MTTHSIESIQQTEHCHIIKNPNILKSEPIIKGTRTPVRAVVETWRRGVAPEEISQGLPHLNLAQIFDALSYYFDHPEEIQNYIEHNQIPQHLIDPLVKNV